FDKAGARTPARLSPRPKHAVDQGGRGLVCNDSELPEVDETRTCGSRVALRCSIASLHHHCWARVYVLRRSLPRTSRVLSRCTPASRDRRSSFTSGTVVCQNARRSGSE